MSHRTDQHQSLQQCQLQSICISPLPVLRGGLCAREGVAELECQRSTSDFWALQPQSPSSPTFVHL